MESKIVVRARGEKISLDATGKLVVEFGILPNGKVTDQKPKERSSNAALDRCITAAFAGWTFPKPPGGGSAVVTYPFVLEPG